mmetsp:Transcript_81406/g.225443  ORF Transcript_81406/g.225443 Transcript_81406/m.225443 type:complete len:182 (-) Transcript_81406:79-624(-)
MSVRPLPKLQPPEGEEARRVVAGASELARQGEMKRAQLALREAVGGGLLSAAAQRQILAWWSAGCYDLPGLGGAPAEAAVERGPGAAAAAPLWRDEAEETITRVMREHRWSHREAKEYIEQGGLEMEAMRSEMEHPMDAAFKKLKEQGPPQWFIDMMTKKEAEASEQPTEPGAETVPAVTA